MLHWTEEAANWLQEIFDYIALDNPNAARKVVEGIYHKAQILNDFPEIGHIHRLEEEGQIRILLYGHYKIAYLLKKNNDIDILGVFHGALDLDRHLVPQ